MMDDPCPACQMNIEINQDQIKVELGTQFKMSVVYYSTLLPVIYGELTKEAGLDAQFIWSKQLLDIARK
jgi:heterodisulfide reductase subunit B